MNAVIRNLLGVVILVSGQNLFRQFDYFTNADGTSITITGYSGPSALVIPSAINGLSVTGIEEFAFGGSDISTVTIPASVTNIGDAAFASCENLTNVSFSFGISDIQSNLFNTCRALPTITIPGSVTNIGDNAFFQCTTLSEVFFTGNAPMVDNTVFQDFYSTGIGPDVPYYTATAYYLPSTTGWEEFSSNTFIQGTNIVIPTVEWNPTIQASGTNFGIQNGQYGFDITAPTNLPIAIEACDDLTESNWVVLQRLTLTNGLFHFSEQFVSSNPARFYRIGFP
jgi:hypothetical protein